MIADIIAIFRNDPFSGMVLVIFVIQWWNSRAVEKTGENTGSAIALASAVVTTFEPLRKLLDGMVDKLNEHDAQARHAVELISDLSANNRNEHETQERLLNEISTNLASYREEIGVDSRQLLAIQTDIKKLKAILKGDVNE